MDSIVSLSGDVRLLQQADGVLVAVGGGEGENGDGYHQEIEGRLWSKLGDGYD